MVAQDRYCIEVLTQISAAQAAPEAIAMGLLDSPVRVCIGDGRAGEPPGDARIDELMRAVGRLRKAI